MTAILKRDLRKLDQNIKNNTSVVQNQFAAAGVTPDPAVVFSTAKYFTTIKKLAQE